MRLKWKILIFLFCTWIVGNILVSDGRSYCSDGSTTYSSGRGTCSWHGGQGMQREKRYLWWAFVASLGIWGYFSFLREQPKPPIKPTIQLNAHAVICPTCGQRMKLRTAHKGRHKGSSFWGCSRYPRCKTIVPLTTSPDRPEQAKSV
jgi:Topoisomerase DNA binding C4 zinc finger